MRSTLPLLLIASTFLVGCFGPPPVRRAGEQPTLTGAQLVEIADALALNGDSVRAEQYLRRAQKENVPERVVLPRLLRLYVRDGQYRLAIEQAEHSLRRHPADTELREFLGTLYVAVGQVEQALGEFEAVVARKPDHASAHYAIASLLHRAGSEHARASEHYRAYLALEPNGEHAEEAEANVMKELP